MTSPWTADRTKMAQVTTQTEAAGLLSAAQPSTGVSPVANHGHRRNQMRHSCYDLTDRPAWNAGKKVGTKRPLKPRQILAIRFFLDRERRLRDRALFDLAIDSKLRGCDLLNIKIGNLVVGQEIRTRATVIQQKTGRSVQFELMSDARSSLLAWLEAAPLHEVEP